MDSFRIKLAAYFVLLSLLPVVAAFWGFSSLAEHDETRRVETRLEAELPTLLVLYQEQVLNAQATATELAGRSDLQRLLERGSRRELARLLAGHKHVEIILPNGTRVGWPRPALAVRRSATVVTGQGLAGTVVSFLPLDEQLAAHLRTRSGIGPDDAVAILRYSRIVAASPAMDGRLSLPAGVPRPISIGGVGYRALAGPLDEFSGEQLAVLTRQSLIDKANSSTRLRLLLLLIAMLLVIAGSAYLEGRAIVGRLQGLVRAANGIARGRHNQRVPVKGRDEFAQLGHAFNEMAGQLETRLEELATERARLGSAIDRIGETLAATLDPEQLLRVVLEATLEAAGATGAVVVDERGEVLQVGKPSESGERLELPLVGEGADFGTLVLSGPQFSEERRRTAHSLSRQAVVALENARLHTLVEQEALVDGLTGLVNRRHCEEALALELAHARRFGTSFSIVLADLDDFKAINDRYGHAVGDVVLREFAGVLRKMVRDLDIAGRWGGEEFILLLPGTATHGAALLAERVRAAIEARILHASNGASFRTTASFGVASYPTVRSVAELFEAADQTLYRAKTSGKNRVEYDR